MVFSAARDGLLPTFLEKINGDVPLNAVMLTVLVLLGVTGLVGADMLDLDQILAIAGQNFLLLYAGSAAALLRLDDKGAHRLLALFCLTLVGLLLVGRGGDGIVYPIVLVMISLVLASLQKRRAAGA